MTDRVLGESGFNLSLEDGTGILIYEKDPAAIVSTLPSASFGPAGEGLNTRRRTFLLCSDIDALQFATFQEQIASEATLLKKTRNTPQFVSLFTKDEYVGLTNLSDNDAQTAIYAKLSDYGYDPSRDQFFPWGDGRLIVLTVGKVLIEHGAISSIGPQNWLEPSVIE